MIGFQKCRFTKTLFFTALLTVSLMFSQAYAASRLVYSQVNDGTTLDRNKAATIPDQNIATLMCEGLVRLKAQKLVPGIAKTWDISADGTAYTFHLRPSNWSDGTPLTAHDFEYSFKRLMDPAIASSYAFVGLPIKNGAAVNEGKIAPAELGVKAIDDLTLQVTLEAPTDYFLNSLALGNFAPVRHDLVEKYGQDYALTADKLSSNGPFMLVEYIPQNKKILKRNPNYWNAEAVHLDEVEVLVVADLMTALQMYQTGQLDFAEVPSTVFPQYKDKTTSYIYTVEWIGFNTKKKAEKPWLANPNFIKAINFAIDRETFTMLSSRGLNLPMQRYVMPGLMGITKSYGEDFPFSYYSTKADKKKAVEYLNKAMQDLGITDPASIEVSYQITADNTDLRRQAEVLQSMITKTLGITFHVTQVEYKHHWASLREGNYELAYQGWVPDYDSPFSYLDIWKTGGYYASRCGYSNPGFDKLVNTATSSPRREDSLQYYFQAEQKLLEDVPIIPLHLRRKAMLVNPNVENLNFYFIGFDIDSAFASKK